MRNAEQIIQALEAAGFYARFLPISAMEQIREHYDTLLARGPDTKWLRSAVKRFRDNQPPKLDFEPRSFLVIAMPSGQGGKLVLRRGGNAIEIIIPPGFAGTDAPEQRLKGILAAVAEGWQLAHTTGISQKLLAALSGLGKYGRNNICYVGDWGSYISLEAHYTDIPYDGPVCESLRMEACETCDLCRKACPTEAIGGTQVIDANRCLTNQNERAGRIAHWVPKYVHHTLFGCMRCQECCPRNPAIEYSHTLELDENETRQLLSRRKKLPKTLSQKFREFGLVDWILPVLKRNARLAVKAKEYAGG